MNPAVAGPELRALGARLSEGTIGAEDAARVAFARIREVEPGVRAFLHLAEDEALDRAREIDVSPPGERGPLGGMPISIKDNIAVRGMPLTCASAILDGFVSPYDATIVRRLRDAGAVIVGKTNLDEFAMGSSTTSGCRGATRNPWDAGRVPGGSSGGAAASVAAGMAVAGIGTDTGGSLRHPAAHCGLAAIRPTWGRVSRFGITAYASSLDQAGCVAWDVATIARVLGAIAGHDPSDATSGREPVPDFEAAARSPELPASVAVPEDANRPALAPEGEEAFARCVDRLEAAGVRIRPAPLPDWDLAVATYYVVACAEASSNLARFDGVRYGPRRAGVRESRSFGFGAEVRERLLLGAACLSAGYETDVYRSAVRHRSAFRRRMLDLLREHDALVLPVAVAPPRRLADTDAARKEYEHDRCNMVASLAGLPALAVPGGSWGGLPFGVQFVGAPWREDRLLKFGAAFEALA